MKKYRKCISCLDLIIKSAKTNPYICRDCEKELEKMDLAIPVYNKSLFKN